jgi:hypothetical protein
MRRAIPAGAEGPELQVRLGQPPAALRPRVGQHRGGGQVTGPPGPGELVQVVRDAWEAIRQQVLTAGLVLAVQFDTPPRRPADAAFPATTGTTADG